MLLGCYYCCETFDSGEIVWRFEREPIPFCPHCDIDAVTNMIDKLKELNEHYFDTIKIQPHNIRSGAGNATT